MSDALEVRCFAKINTLLRVLGPRPDGFHDLDTEFLSIDLADDLRIERRHGGFALEVLGAPPGDVPVEGNLVLRAAHALQEEAGPARIPGALLRLLKRIPAAAGLGGGSSDAAGALVGMARLHGIDVPASRLAEMAAALGSDVPYFLHGGAQRGRGRGEVLEPLPDKPPLPIVLLKPRLPLSTARVFQEHASWRQAHPAHVPSGRPTDPAGGTALDPAWLATAGIEVHDDLADAALRLAPEIRQVADEAAAAFPEGAVGMTGSGPTIFVLLPLETPGIEARMRPLAPLADGWISRLLGGDEYRSRRFV